MHHKCYQDYKSEASNQHVFFSGNFWLEFCSICGGCDLKVYKKTSRLISKVLTGYLISLVFAVDRCIGGNELTLIRIYRER